MPASWSAQFEEHFGVKLPDDVRAWFDDELWQGCDSTLYNQPVSPAELLDARSYAVSGGMMPPDTLPVLGNGAGDCLSLRFDARGAVSEVICWQHETGQWWPFAKTFSEALVLDRIATLSEPPNSDDPNEDADAGYLAEWASRWLPSDVHPIGFRDRFDEPRTVYERLLNAGVADENIRGILCERALNSGLKGYSRRVGARRLGVPWSEARRWLFDSARVPPEAVSRLSREAGMTPGALLCQDWKVAAVHAGAVLEKRKDLAWPFAVVGWSKERAGDVKGAIDAYFSGLRALGSTAAFTDDWALEGHWSGEKFARARLVALEASLPPGIREDAYLSAVFDQRNQRRERGDAIREFWLARAAETNKPGDASDAYHSIYAAGWDDFHTDDMDVILDRLVEAACLARSRAWEKLAAHHRQSLTG
jgi:hypothetical protein